MLVTAFYGISGTEIEEAKRLFGSVPSTNYDYWDLADAKAAATALLYYYQHAADQTTGSYFQQVEFKAKRLTVMRSLGAYLAMWTPAAVTEEKVEQIIGPDRMLFYLALLNERDDDVRQQAAYWAGEIPIRDIRPVRNVRDGWMSFTVQGLLLVALRNPATGTNQIPSANTVITAIQAVQKIVDDTTPNSIRIEVQRAMRTYGPPRTANDIPIYSQTDRAEIYSAATTLLAYVQNLSVPLKPPHPLDDPWRNPTPSQVPRPEPYPPSPSHKRAKLVAGMVGVVLLVVGGAAGIQYYQRKKRVNG